ncbi:hypothetical protein HYALB_00014082, partial [Hymenoscyphus albidus]
MFSTTPQQNTYKKKKERFRLANSIDATQQEIMPCTRCASQGRRCIMDTTQSNRCAECVRTKMKCDGSNDSWDRHVPSEKEWESLDAQEERLRDEEEEAMAKILRLRKQQKFIQERRKEMARRGLKFIDELDAVEELERAKER